MKVVLGWLIDTVAGTIELPAPRVERLHALLATFPRSRKTCPTSDLRKLSSLNAEWSAQAARNDTSAKVRYLLRTIKVAHLLRNVDSIDLDWR